MYQKKKLNVKELTNFVKQHMIILDMDDGILTQPKCNSYVDLLRKDYKHI